MQLSVIILNYNVCHFLELCVLSVQSALVNMDSEIIVVDNNSTDDSASMMKKRFPAIKFIQNKANLGFPKANNIAAAQAKGDYICILNPDTVVAEDTFEIVMAFAKKQENLGIIGVKLIDGSGNFLPESKRGIPTPWVAFTKVAGLYKLFPKFNAFGKYYAQHLAENATGKVAILVGAFMFMKRELYTDLDGFDENCFMYSDDIDLSYRALQLGKDNFYLADTTVIHYKGESTVKDKLYMQRFQEAMQFFYRKHFKSAAAFSVFMTIGSYFFSFVKMLQGKPKKRQEPDSYVFVSDNSELFHKLQLILQKKVSFYNLKTELIVNSSKIYWEPKSELIFDNGAMAFKEIINHFETLKNKKLTFKIRPQKACFLIGSFSSQEPGELVLLE
jgi:GT2 family glycosyltransferase